MLLRIDLVADFICPWCHVGEARLRSALQMLAERQPEVSVEINRVAGGQVAPPDLIVIGQIEP